MKRIRNAEEVRNLKANQKFVKLSSGKTPAICLERIQTFSKLKV